MSSITLNGTLREGVWSIGRNKVGELTIAHERTPNNNTALTSGVLYNFIYVNDYLFQAYTDNGVFGLSKTIDGDTYSHNSIYETKIFTGELHGYDSSWLKFLLGVSVTHEPLGSGASVRVDYMIDEETSFTTILTSDTDNDISREAVNIESSGASLPGDYKEITFRVVATGGAEVTGLSFKEEITSRESYE